MMRRSNSNGKRNRSKFWLIYGLVCATAVTILTVGLFVFYDYIHNLQIYHTETTTTNYVNLLDDDTISSLAKQSLVALNLKYEDPETYVEKCLNAFDKDKILPRKISENKDFTTYEIYIEDLNDSYFENGKFMTITLRADSKVKYGNTKWKVVSAEICINGIVANGKEYTVYVPHGSNLNVNGFTAEVSETNVPSPLANKLEEDKIGNCDVYRLGTLYTTPEFYCDYDGGKYSVLHKDDGIHFFDASLAPKNFSVIAPSDADVFINGILLDKSYVSAENVGNYAPIDKVTAETPKFSAYSTGELFSSPEITAKLGDSELVGTVNGDKCTFKYPDNLMYSLTINVPKGAEVTVGGVKLNELYDPEEFKAFGELTTVAEESPVMDRYFIDGLFTSEFDVKVTLDSKPLNIISELNGNEINYSADQSTTVSPEIAEFALDFTKTYFHYTSSGYVNVDANLNAALAYIEIGSDFYKKVKDSKIGYEFVTPVSSEVYKVLEVSQVYELTDGTFVVRIDFDVEQTIVYVKRNYSGKLLLHITDGDMKVRDMVIDSTSVEGQ